jgi:hypothetical protein
VIGLLTCICLALTGADSPDAAAPSSEKVAALVRQLDAREFSQREDAERKLLEMGPAVLPLLPSVGDRTPAEIAQRVTRVQQKLLSAQAAAAAEPTTVALRGDEMSLAEVLAAIGKQTGNPIVDHRRAFGEEMVDAKIKCAFDKTPFWKAMDNVLDQAELTLYAFAGKRGAFVISRPPGGTPRESHAVYAGVFRLEPLRFEALRELRNERAKALKFFMEVTWEPRLQPIAIVQPLGQVSAVADDGQPIEITSAEAEPEAMIREGIAAAELEIPLELPKRGIEKIRSLKGKLRALVPGPAQDFRFKGLPITARNAPAQRVERRQAGAMVTIDHVRKNNDAWEVALRVKFDDPANSLESHRGWILENEAFFQNAAGARFDPGGFEQTRQAKDEVGINYYFDLKESPEKLEFVYRTPITILEMGVDYEFRDLALP